MVPYIPTRMDLDTLLRRPTDNDTVLRCATLKAIWTAASTAGSSIVGDTTTASISVGSASGQQVENLFNDLQQAGLVVTNSGSTFTVTF